MRFAIALAAALSILIATPAVQAAGNVAGSTASAEYVAQAQQQPPGQAQIEVDVNREGGGAWWTSPIWIAIGVVALLLLIAIIAMAARGGGGGTTVIRD
jgi:hypothetical protein